MKNRSLFSTGNFFQPWRILERWLNPYTYSANIRIDGSDILVKWSRRAQKAMLENPAGLVAEMQLYFSCVVKKRVIFSNETSQDAISVNDKLAIAFNCVQASSCSPEEFAQNYPAKHNLESAGALKMHPKSLHIDYRNNQWIGEFTV